MCDIQNIKFYNNSLESLLKMNLNFSELRNSNILVTGATGLIGRVLVDTIMLINKELNYNINVYIISRKLDNIKNSFKKYIDDMNFNYIIGDIKNFNNFNNKIDYIFHLASNANPKLYRDDPLGTIDTNYLGTKNILEFAYKNNVKKIVYGSTFEIYGNNENNSKIKENDLGYINCNSKRAAYNESKRLAETICSIYVQDKNMDIRIARFCKIYGPTYMKDDDKVIFQFLNNAINNQDIILKSNGKQTYSYCYVIDAISALFYILLNGKCGEAYNIASREELNLKNIANKIATIAHVKTSFKLPTDEEQNNITQINNLILDTSKLKNIGWKDNYTFDMGLNETINICKQIKNSKK